jgi:hypothetical protein
VAVQTKQVRKLYTSETIQNTVNTGKHAIKIKINVSVKIIQK